MAGMISPPCALGRACNHVQVHRHGVYSRAHHITQRLSTKSASIFRASIPLQCQNPRLYSTALGDDPRLKDLGKLIQDDYAKLKDQYGMSQVLAVSISYFRRSKTITN